MFAVPGWSVSADNLKTERPSTATGGSAAGSADAPASSARSRKRKRAAAAKEESVTADNVADLYESVVEGKKRPAPGGAEGAKVVSKKQKKSGSEDGKRGEGKQSKPEAVKVKGEETGKEQKKKDKKSKDIGDKKDKTPAKDTSSSSKTDTITKPQPAAALPPALSKLTPLQASMREKLISARFRHLNETLYTRPSVEAFDLFQESPEMFDEYHEGFRRQVKVWPENPVDSFLQDIRTRGKIKTPFGKGRPNAPQAKWIATALPRTQGVCTVADLGCGDARLAESLQADRKKLSLDLRSFDLQSPSPLVTKADIANLPLADDSVNVAIFCLALMGTNWLDFVEEAYRVLHWKGELWVAEIKSRFAPAARPGHKAPVTHSVGHRRKSNTAATKKETAAREAKAAGRMEEALSVEVDGNDDRRRETDVSAFVDALRARGFVLQADRQSDAVDLSNKMFVKMHFVKGTTPTRGKGAPPPPESTSTAAPAKKRKAFAWGGNDQDKEGELQVDESSILKPCVYKIR